MNFKEFYDTYWRRGGYVPQVYAYPEYKKAYIKKIKLRNKRILDIGCGDGSFSSLLLNNNNQIIGLDISDMAVRIAQERGIHAEYFDINDHLTFEDGLFDAVLIFDTLEHVFDPYFVLKESYRVLKENGTLYCGIPNASMILNRIHFLFTGNFKDSSAISDKIIPEKNLMWSLKNNSGVIKTDSSVISDKIILELFFSDHIRFFSPKTIKTLLKQCKFSIRKTDYWFPDYFESAAHNKFSWIAKAVAAFKIEKLFPGLISFNMFIEAHKD